MLKPKVGLALALVQVFFGVHYFAAKLILQSMPPRAWAALRITSAAALLLAYAAIGHRRPVPAPRALGRLALYALFGIVINQVMFVEGLARTTPSHSAVINSLIPVATLGFALLLGQERLSLGRIAALVVSLASVLVLLGVERLRFDDALVVGDLMTLVNGVSFAFFLVISRDFLRHNDPLVATTYLLGFGALGILAVGAGPLARVDFAALPGRFWLLAAYAVLFATVLTYFLNYYALRHTDSSMVALFIYLQPPIATALSMTFLGERPSPRFWIAAAGIFAGVYLAVRERTRTEAARSGRRDGVPGAAEVSAPASGREAGDLRTRSRSRGRTRGASPDAASSSRSRRRCRSRRATGP